MMESLAFVARQIDVALGHLRVQCTDPGGFNSQHLDDHQQALFDLATSSAEIQCARQYLHIACEQDEFDLWLANTFAAEVLQKVNARLLRCPEDFGLSREQLLMPAEIAVRCHERLGGSRLAELGQAIVDRGGSLGNRGLDTEKMLMAATFRQFADEVVAPLAGSMHRDDTLIPAEILDGVRDLGCFGLSVPEQYGGLLPDDREDNLGMIVVTEELSRVSLGGAGSLITRPEIMARALLEGGTVEQKQYWLPRIATGEPLCAIAITEPDFGSDVASIQLRATPTDEGWILNGAKTWSTFAGKAGVVLTLARTDPDLSLGHRGLSLFMVEKPSSDEHTFVVEQANGGKLTGTSIATVGYRGMHSFALFFDDFFVPASHLVGEGQGVGRGFYFTMRGFMGGRIQTAARACGVMHGCFEKALAYAQERSVFGRPVASYQLTLVKLARMAMYLAASRQYTYAIARMMDAGSGQMEASLVKLFTCKAAEWIAREAMQIHGGMGYAEESAVSRYWIDARVLSIFEGTEETLALKVVGRSLVENAG